MMLEPGDVMVTTHSFSVLDGTRDYVDKGECFMIVSVEDISQSTTRVLAIIMGETFKIDTRSSSVFLRNFKREGFEGENPDSPVWFFTLSEVSKRLF